MEYKYVLYDKKDNTAKITLNYPEKLNVLNMMGTNEGVRTDMLAALTEAEDDDDVKVVIIKGAGKSFCAGEDLRQAGFMYGFGDGKDPSKRRPSQRIKLKMDKKFMSDQNRILFSPKLTIGQGHGYCLGAGCLALLFCDFSIVAEDAIMGFVEERIGTVGGANPFVMPLVLTVGLKRARDLVFTGRRFSGKEAAEMGMVTKAVPADKLEEEVNNLAADLSLLPRDGIAIGKAHWDMMYNIFGMPASNMATAYIMHTLFTNIRWEPDEYNYFKQRRDKGVKTALHGMHDRYAMDAEE